MNRRNFIKCIGVVCGTTIIKPSFILTKAHEEKPTPKLNWVQQVVMREFGTDSSCFILSKREFKQARWRINEPVEPVPTNPNCLTIQVRTRPNQNIDSDLEIDWIRIVGPK